MRVKKENEWKTEFSMSEGTFKPTVMFFGLTNSPATFQAMINNLLRDMIKAEDIAIFINDVMVEQR